MPISNTLKADLLLIVVTLLAAAGWLFSKETVAAMPPLLFIGIRFLLAGATLFLIDRFAMEKFVIGHASATALTQRQWLQAAGIGVLFGMAIMLWVSGLFHGPHLGEGAFICSLGVVLVPITAALFFRERPSPATWYAIPVAIAGLAFISLNHGFSLSLGHIYYIAAACVFSLHFNFNGMAVAHIPAVVLTAVQLTVVGVMSLSTSWLIETWPDTIALSTWGWLLASVFIATSLRFFLQTYAQQFASASHAAVLMILEPVWTLLIGIFWFDEGMSPWQLIGCSLIFLALIINRWRIIQQMLRGTAH